MLTKDLPQVMDKVTALDILRYPVIRKRRPDDRKDMTTYCKYHIDYDHNIDECI